MKSTIFRDLSTNVIILQAYYGTVSCHYVVNENEANRHVQQPNCVKDIHIQIQWPSFSKRIHRVTVKSFCSISMPVVFCRHLVGKNTEMFVTVIALKYALLLSQ